MIIRIRITKKTFRIIIRVNIIITITMKTIRVARMRMRMIKAMGVTGGNIIITTIKSRIIRIARVIKIIIRMRISAMTIGK